MKSDEGFRVCFEIKEAAAFEFTLLILKRKKNKCAKNKQCLGRSYFIFCLTITINTYLFTQSASSDNAANIKNSFGILSLLNVEL